MRGALVMTSYCSLTGEETNFCIIFLPRSATSSMKTADDYFTDVSDLSSMKDITIGGNTLNFMSCPLTHYSH